MKNTAYNLDTLESTQVKSIVPELLNDNGLPEKVAPKRDDSEWHGMVVR